MFSIYTIALNQRYAFYAKVIENRFKLTLSSDSDFITDVFSLMRVKKQRIGAKGLVMEFESYSSHHGGLAQPWFPTNHSDKCWDRVLIDSYGRFLPKLYNIDQEKPRIWLSRIGTMATSPLLPLGLGY